MLNMLIIDDEPIIADGLSLLVETHYADRIRIHRAYTIEAALQHCYRTKLDIVLSDVLMPEMNGLQLQEQIRKQWEQCQFIFITGHDDFPYIQQALRNGTVSYILKTEGDEAILSAIDRAVERISRAYQTEKILKEAAAYRQEALPLLRNQLFLRWLRGDWGSEEETTEEMKVLGFTLDENASVFPILIQFSLPKQHGTAQSIHPFFVMRSIVQTLLNNVEHMDFQIGVSSQAYLFQGREGYERKVIGSLEQLQELFEQQTGQQVSIIASREAESWKNLNHVFYNMEYAARENAGSHYVYLLDASDSRDELFDTKFCLEEMKRALNERRREAFFENFEKLTGEFSNAKGKYTAEQRMSHAFQMIAMACEVCTEMNQIAPLDTTMYVKTINDLVLRPAAWENCANRFRELFIRLFVVMDEQQDLRSHQLISKLHQFIHEHLSEELSLTRLGEVVGYNASYLSSVYKKLTGQSLVDCINHIRLERAIQLLADPALRVRQVALECGFESQQYFNKSFKKKWGMTPNEYRCKKLDIPSI